MRFVDIFSSSHEVCLCSECSRGAWLAIAATCRTESVALIDYSVEFRCACSRAPSGFLCGMRMMVTSSPKAEDHCVAIARFASIRQLSELCIDLV